MNKEQIERALTDPACERLRDFFEAGPAQRAALEAFVSALRPGEPVAFADKIAFESAMKIGKGCDVWPKKGDYEQRTGRSVIALYTHSVCGEPVAWRFNVDGQWFTGSTREACHKVMVNAGIDSEIFPLYAAPADSVPEADSVAALRAKLAEAEQRLRETRIQCDLLASRPSPLEVFAPLLQEIRDVAYNEQFDPRDRLQRIISSSLRYEPQVKARRTTHG